MAKGWIMELTFGAVFVCMSMPAIAQPTPQTMRTVQCHPSGTLKRLFLLSQTGVLSVAFSPHQRDLYILESTISPVTTSMSARGVELVRKIDLDTGKVIGTIYLQKPGPGLHSTLSSTATGSMALSQNGHRLYVADDQQRINVISTLRWKVLRRFPVLPLDPRQILLSPSGKTLFVRSNLIPSYGFALAAYATATGKREWISSYEPGHFNFMSLAYWPAERSLVSAVLGTTPYNTVGGDQGLRLIDPKTGRLGRTVVRGPFAFAVPGRGLTLYAARYSNNAAIASMDLLRLEGESSKITAEVSNLKGLGELAYNVTDNVLYAGYLSSKPDQSVFTAYESTSLKPLASVTCNSFMLAGSMGFMRVAKHRNGIYVVGPYWLWLLKTNKVGIFAR